MIGKISAPRGEHVEPLIRYLYGPGRREEHTDPHIVAGWRHPAELEPPLRAGGKRDFRRLTGLLNQPHAAMGTWGYARPVWHCSMRAAPEDKTLSDDEWAQIAHDVMHRTGLAPYGEEDDAVRWVAIRHGDDHIHIVVMLARQDGRRPSVRNDRYRVRDACLAAEQRYGLRSTAPGDRTAARQPSRAESEKAARRGLEEAPRITLRRQVSTAAAAAVNEQEFFARLRQSGVLVRTRHSSRDPGQVTGYAVALPGDTAKGGDQVWYGGGKLAADLSLPKLRRRWPRPGAEDRFTAAERAAAWEHAAQAVDRASAHIRELLAGSDPGAAADAAWATSGTLHAAAAALGSRVLREAADAYDRAARAPYGRIPAAHPGRGWPAPGRPAAVGLRVHHQRPVVPAAAADRPACRARRGGRRPPPDPAARGPGRQRPAYCRAAARRQGVLCRAGPARHLPAQPAAALADAGFPVPPGPVPAGPHAPAPSPRTPPDHGQDPVSSHGATDTTITQGGHDGHL